jgi:hypothetical protein
MNPYLRNAERLRQEAEQKLQQRLNEEASIETIDVAVVERARDELGRFIADDPSTPDVNEAWTEAVL